MSQAPAIRGDEIPQTAARCHNDAYRYQNRGPMDSDPLSTHVGHADPSPRPDFEAEYRAWLRETHGIGVGPQTSSQFAEVSQRLARELSASSFWNALPDRLKRLNANHKVERGYALLAAPGKSPDVDIKSWTSFWDKTYRLNVLSNNRWPDAPARGWVLPETWFAQIGDIVRTKIVVKYLDGMTIVADDIARLAADFGLSTQSGRVAKTEGYYATHVDVSFPVEVSTGLDTEVLDTHVEIQITTELQENIYDLAHGHYESRRMAQEPGEWQWNYTSDEFSANYLGHVLHYLEGMIMRLRRQDNE